MRHLLVTTALLIAGLSVASAAAPMSTSERLAPNATQSIAYKCERVCTRYGYCGYGHDRHKCCKSWRKVCH